MTALPAQGSARPLPWLRIGAWAAAALAVAPLVAVIALAITRPATPDLSTAVILRYALNSAVLAVLVGTGVIVLGVTSAWLVVMYRFPGRSLFSWALALPLAAPTFAIAYGYADLLDVAGPVQTWLRGVTGGAVFFNIRTLPFAALVLSLAFYPYVYLTARAAFISQSVCALEAGRTLGASALATFWRVALPLARPAMAAGGALAVMETLADYGAVNFLGVQTLTTGVVRAWSIFGAPGSAAQLALFLIGAAAILMWVEYAARRGQSYEATSSKWRAQNGAPLPAIPAIGASLYCGLLIVLALVLPAGWLAWKGLQALPEWDRIARAAGVSFGLAVAGSLITVALASLIAFGERRDPVIKRIASLGYATPGAVMAVGLMAPAVMIWRGFGIVPTAAATGLTLLVFAYAARLMASAVGPIEAGLARVTPSMDRAARMLGEDEAGSLRRVHAPIASAAVWTAAILVFVDVLKELPATLILRPFNFDTLAVLADRYASDERLANAAWPSLIIVGVAAIPVALLSRKVMKSRPGAGA